MHASPAAVDAVPAPPGDGDDRHEAELWRLYRERADVDARDRLFRRYMPWADALGRSVYRRVSIYSLDVEDFVQNAELGLLDAISRFDQDRGVDFRTYARTRVRGAVFNGVRAMLQDRKAPPDAGVYADRLTDLDAGGGDAFASVVDAIVGLGIGYLLDQAVNAHQADAYEYARREQVGANVGAAVRRLPARLRGVVVQHYYHQVPLSVLAERMGVTRGRLSQLHREALTRLRDALRTRV